MYSATQAATILRISNRRVRQLAEIGKIGRRVGCRWKFTEAEVEEFQKTRKPARPLCPTCRRPM